MIRPLVAADQERIRELTLEAKAHWGYDRDLVRRWATGSRFEREDDRWVVEVGGRVVAWAGLVPPADGVAVLDDLWVDPEWIGRGLGTRLFRLVVDRACELGAARLEWGAELHARGFYAKQGGRFLRRHVTEWGREGEWWGTDL